MGGEATTAAAGDQYPERQHPSCGSTGDGRHADNRHHAGSNRYKAWSSARGEHERAEYREAIAGVGASTDQP